MTLRDLALLVGRLLASAIFVRAGYGKLMGMAGTVAYFEKVGVPIPQIAYYGAVAVELGGGLLLLVGLFTRPVAVVLAAFCIATGLLVHYHPGDAGQMVHFMKNLAMAGGYLAFAVAGAGLFSVDGAIARGRA